MPDMESDEGSHESAHEQRHLPAPREIYKGLNEYVIGQNNVKIALSVGVHNHYKRITVMDALAAERERNEAAASMSIPGTVPISNPHSDLNGGGISDLNLSQFGRTKDDAGFCETPDWKEGLTQDGAVEIVEKCIKELQVRFLLAQPNFIIKVIDKDGVRTLKFGADPADN